MRRVIAVALLEMAVKRKRQNDGEVYQSGLQLVISQRGLSDVKTLFRVMVDQIATKKN